jgi:CRISPR-associated protein Cas1
MITTILKTDAGKETPELVPVGILHEFAYCPRLAYLQWVQAERSETVELLEGAFVHRAVDQPSPRDVPDSAATPDSPGGADDVIHARSVTLSAPREGLIARLDLIDLQAGVAVPVEYKRGRVPDVPGNAWEPEQVQLCAQGLILRENGYLCEGGVLYFAQSRRRVSVPFEALLIERTRQLLRELRQVAASQVVPPPLIHSPKCPRCSLVGICLPDETVLLQGTLAVERPAEPRRLVPARDDALPLYIEEQGATLGKSGEELVVRKGSDVLRQVKLKDVSQVSIFGNVLITAQALRELAADGIPLCHFSYGGWFQAITSGLVHKNAELRIRQFRLAGDPAESLRLARCFVAGKIKNCRTLVRRHLEAPDRSVLDRLAHLGRKSLHAADMASLLGIEGVAAKVYFGAFAGLLKQGAPFDFEGRNRRPPRDPINALISYLAAILVKELTIALSAVGLDPMVGFYHQPRYGRPSLALDLAEEFRPLVIDSVVLTLVNHDEIAEEHFVRRAGAVALTSPGRKAVLAAFERRMDALVTHPVFKYRISYRRVLAVQARLLARTVLGEIPEYPSFYTR